MGRVTSTLAGRADPGRPGRSIQGKVGRPRPDRTYVLVCQLFAKLGFNAQLRCAPNIQYRTYIHPLHIVVFCHFNYSLKLLLTHSSPPNIRSEHTFDVCAAAVVWGRTPMWELRPTIGAAWELHLAAAFGRPGAAAGSCAGPAVKFSHGSCKFVGAVIQPLPAAAKRMGAASELRRTLLELQPLQNLT